MLIEDQPPRVFKDQPISQLLIKVASRCNIDCSYCYWFRDPAVYSKPKMMSDSVLEQLLRRMEEHVAKHSLAALPVVLHGGEPLLWGVEKFNRFAAGCDAITERTGCGIPIAVTTNGVLINDAWADCFEANGISVAISLDGPSHIHDAHRKTFQGGGTHAAAERAARLLLARNVFVSALAVCNPTHSPESYTDFFAGCGIDHYDIMIPDATVDEKPASIATFYNGLFDYWLKANRDKETVEIRTVTDMVAALLGRHAPTEGVGYQAVELCTVVTDGTVEAHDVLRIAGEGTSETTFNIFDHALDEVRNEPRWKAARDASINLAAKCRQCKYMNVCGGGYLPHRFSKDKGYDNPSVYCDDLYAMYENMDEVLQQHLYVSKPDGQRVGIATK
jgi:uncharacterized protein